MFNEEEEKILIDNAIPLLEEYKSNEGQYSIKGFLMGTVAYSFLYLNNEGGFSPCEYKNEKGHIDTKNGSLKFEIYNILLSYYNRSIGIEAEKWNLATIKVSKEAILESEFVWDYDTYISQLINISESFILWLYDASCDFLSSKIENFAGEGLLYIDVKKGSNTQELKFSVEIDGKTQLFYLPITKISFPEEAEQAYLQERFLNAFNLQFMVHVEGVLSKRWNRIIMRLNPIYWRGYDLNWERINFEYDETLE